MFVVGRDQYGNGRGVETLEELEAWASTLRVELQEVEELISKKLREAPRHVFTIEKVYLWIARQERLGRPPTRKQVLTAFQGNTSVDYLINKGSVLVVERLEPANTYRHLQDEPWIKVKRLYTNPSRPYAPRMRGRPKKEKCVEPD